jgi:DNA helicase-2/ATP-dependent DNA helicase PcrA
MNYLETGKVRGKNRELLISESLGIIEECRKMDFWGDPIVDWRSVRSVIDQATCPVIRQLARDAHYIKLLHKGSLLRSSLANLWRDKGNYSGASDAVRNALLQEHFSVSTKVWSGINLMTMHKAKGKEFDEVIIYEGCYQGKIIRNDASDREINQALLNLRVSITRAIKKTTILTPRNDPCQFLH